MASFVIFRSELVRHSIGVKFAPAHLAIKFPKLNSIVLYQYE